MFSWQTKIAFLNLDVDFTTIIICQHVTPFHVDSAASIADACLYKVFMFYTSTYNEVKIKREKIYTLFNLKHKTPEILDIIKYGWSYREVALVVRLKLVILGLDLSGQLLLLGNGAGNCLLIGLFQSVRKLLFLSQDLRHGLRLSTRQHRHHFTHVEFHSS